MAALTFAGLAPTSAATGGLSSDENESRSTVGAGARGAPNAPEARRCGAADTPPGNPRGLVDVRGTLFFAADDGVHGRELWRSDGTEAGTVLVKDLNPNGRRSGDPYQLTARGGTLFFTANDGEHGPELWTSDGTRAGTVMVEDISPDPEGYEGPEDLTALGRTLFFTVDDGRRGRELWRSDGTKAGTALVKDIRRGEDEYGGYAPSDLTAVGDRLFLTADDGSHGRELWTSDGTRAGTVMVEDILPGPGASQYYPALTGVGGTLYFTADDGAHGHELWTSDGTTAGTVLVEDINPGGYDSVTYLSQNLVGMGRTAFFPARDGVHGRELWRSDGTAPGTRLVKDIHPDPRAGRPSDLTAVGNALFFTADDGTPGTQLWTSDGTEAGTALVRDFDAVEDSYYDEPDLLTDVGGRLFFAADDGVHGRELWTSDGTTAGTVMVEDINPETDEGGYGSPYSLTGVGDTLFFSADDGVHGDELWRSDGTRRGTVQVADINKGGGFRVAPRAEAKANPRNGTVRVRVRVEGAGDLVVGPARGSRIKQSTTDVRSAGRTTVTLEPTRKGMRKLRQALREARRDGREVGKVRVKARFTFTPCGGDPSSQTRRYVLKLR